MGSQIPQPPPCLSPALLQSPELDSGNPIPTLPTEGIAYIDNMPAGVLVVIPDEEVNEDAPVEL